MGDQSATARVLIVDDEQYEPQSLSEMVSHMGHSVETCEDGEEALEKIELAPFDVILTDLMMPRMDGSRYCGPCRAVQI
jgi:CheY-like chemotaxis protein